MKKLFAFLFAVLMLGALTGANAWAADPETSVIDRHAVWTKIIEDNKKMIEENKKEGNKSSEKQTEQASNEDHAKMDAQFKDVPWQRVG